MDDDRDSVGCSNFLDGSVSVSAPVLEVVLRADQVDLIAKRVIEMLEEAAEDDYLD